MDSDPEIFGLAEEEKPYDIKYRCYYFSRRIVLFVREAKDEKVYGSLFNQLIRSAAFIGANLVEGKAGEFEKKLEKFSCN